MNLDDLKARYTGQPDSTSPSSNGLDVVAYLEHYGRKVLGAKPNGDGTFYLLDECVFDSNHRKGQASIGKTYGGKLFYKCFHDSCQGRTWAEAREIISGKDKLDRFMGGNGNNCSQNGANWHQPEEKPEETPRITMRDAILSADDLMKMEIPERLHYLHPWLRDRSIININGQRGDGKSMFAMAVAKAITTGTEYGPWQCYESVPSLFVDGEMLEGDDKERLTMFGTPEGLELAFYNDCYATNMGLPKANLTNQAWREEFKALVLDMGYKVVFFDNIASLAPGLVENSKEEWDPVNQWRLELRFAGVANICLHHAGKSGAQRGTSGREDNCDVVIDLIKPSNYVTEDGCRFIVHFSKHRIPQNDLSLIGDTEFRLIRDGGSFTWQWGNVALEAKKECLKLLAKGTDQKTIGEILGKAKGTISKWKNSFIEKGYLTSTGALTPLGARVLGSDYDE